MLCFVVVMHSFIMNSHEVFIHIHQGCFAGTGAIVRLPQCQWSKPDGYGKISQCITTTKHSKAKTVCIFLGIYCRLPMVQIMAWQVPSHCLNQSGLIVYWIIGHKLLIKINKIPFKKMKLKMSPVNFRALYWKRMMFQFNEIETIHLTGLSHVKVAK